MPTDLLLTPAELIIGAKAIAARGIDRWENLAEPYQGELVDDFAAAIGAVNGHRRAVAAVNELIAGQPEPVIAGLLSW